MSRRKTHEEYVAELAIKNPTVEVVGEYVDSYTKILHHCLIHDVYWDVLPPNALKGKGCKECMKEKNRNRFIKSHEDYVSQLKEITPDIVVLEKYLGGDIPILHLCKKHDIKWMAYPNNILRGQGCVECGKEKFHDKRCKKHEDYALELSIKNPTVEVVEEYIDSKTPILHHCLTHDIYWKLQPANALRGDGCEMCHWERIGISNGRTHEEYISKLKLVNPDIIVIGDYINSNTPILHKCLIDGHEWFAYPSNVLSGCGCPQCQESSGERQIRQWLENHDVEFAYQYTFKDCRDIKSLPFDFYLPNYNVCIEYDGGQHYKPVDKFGGVESFEKTIKHDNIKNNYCHENNILLLRIPYFKNVEEELNNFLFI